MTGDSTELSIFDCLHEVAPALLVFARPFDLLNAEAVHCDQVGLNLLVLEVGDRYFSQVYNQKVLEDVVVDDVSLRLLNRRQQLLRLRCLARIGLKHPFECKLA